MPHCIIEYSNSLSDRVSPDQLLSTVYFSLSEMGIFKADDIKVRAIAYEHFSTGNTRQDFIHTDIKILSGRDLDCRRNVSYSVLERLQALFDCAVSLTVEVTEIEKESYAKVVLD